MSYTQPWMHSPAAMAMAKTLLYSLWQTGIAALALAGLLAVVRSSRVRYAAACCALLATTLAATATFAHFNARRGAGANSRTTVTLVPELLDDFSAANSIAGNFIHFRLQDALPWLTPIWLAGVLIFTLRQLATWLGVRRIGSRGVCSAPESWQSRLNAIRSQLNVSRPVLLLESCIAGIPMVLGHARPVILMPVGLLAGLPVEQIELILMHELAHIRRCDYAVNVLQTSVEVLMFYNPAVWWISGVIRTEREHCCDDLVVAATNDAHAYASALAALEYARSTNAAVSIAATGGSLVKRIRRLLKHREATGITLAPVACAALLVVITTMALTARPALPTFVELPGLTSPSQVAAPALAEPLQQEPAQAPARQNVNPPQPEPPSLRRWLDEDVHYIITNEERTAFERLRTDEERVQFIEQFWLRRNPVPGSVENEFRTEYDRRIAYVNQRFGTLSGMPGWQTDRGKVYITLGPPDEVRTLTVGFAVEIWRYRYVEGLGANILITFSDPSGSGEFRRVVDPGGR